MTGTLPIASPRATDFAREPLQVVEIIQPLCSREFGVAPCMATGTPCYKTDASCKSIEALDLTDQIAIRFVEPAANRYIPVAGAFQPSTAIPLLRDVKTAPTVLNVAAGDANISPMGGRAVVNITIADAPHNDVGIDPHIDARDHDPNTRGTFWSKWLARNPFHTGVTVNHYDGYFGDALTEMVRREYSMERVARTMDLVRVTAKDILHLITDTDIMDPALSPGVLALDIGAEASSLLVAGADLDDYPAPGRLRIGSEVIGYTTTALTGGDSIEFSGLTRGDLKTTVSDHSQNAHVQWVLSYEDELYVDILHDLIITRSPIPDDYANKAAWDAEGLEWRQLYRFTAHITQPTRKTVLISELCQQSISNIWWDERLRLIQHRALRPNFFPDTITERGDIIAGSLRMDEVAKDRVTQVYVYFGLRNPTLPLEDPKSYLFAEAITDVDKQRQYGTPAIKEIFCRWVPSGVLALSLGGAYMSRFRDVRRHVHFDLTSKDIARFWTGDAANLIHFMDTDMDGLSRAGQWLITSAEVADQGGTYRYTAEDNESAGLLWELVADDDPRPVTEIGCWVDKDGTDGAGIEIPFRWI